MVVQAVLSLLLSMVFVFIVAAPANAAGVKITNDYYSSWAIYAYKYNYCSGTKYTLYPGYSLYGAYSFKSSVSGYVKWSNGNTTRFSGGECINTPLSARVYN